jgi:MFS family permease
LYVLRIYIGKGFAPLELASPTAPSQPAFARDRFTWMAYFLLGYFAYLQSLLGPLMPFLRAELGLSYVLGSFHLSAFAAGMILVGLVGDMIVRRTGLRAALWGGALMMGIGAVTLTLGAHPAATIAATLFMGLSGTILLVAQQASLSHHHGALRAVAFTEANIIASIGSFCAPLVIGAAVSAAIGWRVALLLPLAPLALLIAREGRRPVPEPPPVAAGAAAPARLPRRFWAYWSVACLGVAVEWSLGFWGADYLHTVAGLSIELAVTAMSIFFLCMLAGRVVGSRLARRVTPAQLLVGTLALALVGVVVLRAAPYAAVTLVGLAIAGLGIGNLFPMALAAAVEHAAGRAATASARMSLAGGLAIFIAPLVLGSWADQIGLSGAFAIVPALVAIALVIALIAWRSIKTAT